MITNYFVLCRINFHYLDFIRKFNKQCKCHSTLFNYKTWRRCITRNALGGKQEEIKNENVIFTKFDNVFFEELRCKFNAIFELISGINDFSLFRGWIFPVGILLSTSHAQHFMFKIERIPLRVSSLWRPWEIKRLCKAYKIALHRVRLHERIVLRCKVYSRSPRMPLAITVFSRHYMPLNFFFVGNLFSLPFALEPHSWFHWH